MDRRKAGEVKRPKKFELEEAIEIEKRSREIKLIINVIEPDPEMQPFILTDPATVFDACGNANEDIEARLRAYFGDSVDLDLTLPLWQLVDSIERQFPGWPDDWPPEAK